MKIQTDKFFHRRLVLEQTLVLLKPDAVRRGLMGQILGRFERSSMCVVGMKMLIPTRDLASDHYGDLDVRYGKAVKQQVVDFLASGRVCALVLEGDGVVELVRSMIGSTDPAKAQLGTIRCDFPCMSLAESRRYDVALQNLVHASANLEDAKKEIALWFDGHELHSYYDGGD